MGMIPKKIQRPRPVQRLLGPSVPLLELVEPLLGQPVALAELAGLLLQPIAEPPEPVDLLPGQFLALVELVEPLLGRLPELVRFQVAKRLAAEPVEPLVEPVGLVVELVEPVDWLAGLVVELVGPVAWPAGLVVELVGPVAEIVQRLRQIHRPQIGFPQRIVRRRLEVLESQATFGRFPSLLPRFSSDCWRSDVGFACRLLGLLTGRCLGFLGQFVELLGELFVL